MQGSWYFKPGLEDKIIQLEDSENANVSFVDQVQSPDKIKKEIFNAIIELLTKVFEIEKNAKHVSLPSF